MRGRIGRLSGTEDTGKTVCVLTAAAEMAHDSRFDNWEIIFDEPEESNAWDMSDFGKLAARMQPPEPGRTVTRKNEDGKKFEMPQPHSFYAEEFYFSLFKRLDSGKQCLYMLDSLDALKSLASMEKFETHMKQMAAGDELDGVMTDGKAKLHSQNLPIVKSLLKQTQSVLLLISQARDDVGSPIAGAMSTSGGRGLKHNACYHIWLKKKQELMRSIEGVNRRVGMLVTVKVDKNHATGKHMQFDMPFYYGYGIDDERTSIIWLIENKVWTKNDAGAVDTNGFTPVRLNEKNKPILPNEKALAEMLRRPEWREPFKNFVQEKWNRIEELVRLPSRYAST
jgi:hypothetical protein